MKETLRKHWRRKSVGRARVRIYLRQKGQPAKVRMATGLHPSATQPTPWPAVQPRPLSCRCPQHSLRRGEMSHLCRFSIWNFLAVFVSVMIVRLWLCSPPPSTWKSFNFPPTADRPAVRTRRQSRPRKSGRNPSCWFGGPLPTTGEGSRFLW